MGLSYGIAGKRPCDEEPEPTPPRPRREPFAPMFASQPGDPEPRSRHDGLLDEGEHLQPGPEPHQPSDSWPYRLAGSPERPQDA